MGYISWYLLAHGSMSYIVHGKVTTNSNRLVPSLAQDAETIDCI